MLALPRPIMTDLTQPEPRSRIAQRMVRALISSVALLSMTILVNACGAPQEASPGHEHACAEFESDFCNGITDESGAYTPAHGRLLCRVIGIREESHNGEGDVDRLVDYLPDWGDGSQENGEPVILDVRSVPRWNVDAYINTLGRAADYAGFSERDADFWSCARRSSQEWLEEELGGPLRTMEPPEDSNRPLHWPTWEEPDLPDE